MAHAKRPPDSRFAWFMKALAGLLFGYGLAIALSGLFAWLGPGGMEPVNKYQVTMWMVPPIWLSVLSGVFLFSSAKQAWAWLSIFTTVAFFLLYITRYFLG